MQELRILSPTAILGYGFPEASFRAGLALRPDVIAVDAGSTDPGPWYLGAGVSFADRLAVKRDLRLILRAGRELGVPVIVGSAGGAGAAPHLAWTLDIVRELAREEDLRFRLGAIPADIPHGTVLEALDRGEIAPLTAVPPLTRGDVEASPHIVGQMGVEPFVRALEGGAEVVVAGRAYDPAVFAALPVHRGFDTGLALHLGKILECAAIAATPGSGSDCMMGRLRGDHFLVEPTNPERRCTVTSVAAHTLYEKSDPYRLPGPGGLLDLTETRFEQATERAVRVSGTRHERAGRYTVKLEGARPAGFRTVCIAGARDPFFIERSDEIVAGVRARVADNFRDTEAARWRLDFHLYGKNGVMGALEPVKDARPHELGIVIEATADAPDLAKAICGFARATMLHFGYPGRVSTAGNLAFPYSPSDFDGGTVYRFSVHHLLPIEDPCAPFPVRFEEVGT